MRIATPFVVIHVSPAGAARFQAVLDDLQGAGHTPWGRWVLEAIPRTHTERDANGALYWFRADGDPGDLPRNPCPGIAVYANGDDAPTSIEPATVHNAQLLMGVAIGRFVRRLAEEGAGDTPATDLAPEEPDAGPTTGTGGQAEILRALRLTTTGAFEIRALGARTASGYYDQDHLAQAARDVDALDAAGTYGGVYVVLNEISPALLSRRANRIETRLAPGAATTADADVIRRRWLPIDIDPRRPSGVSSTDAEHEYAVDAARRISGFLAEFCGFPGPIRADSGNGAHLLYRVDLPNDDESRNLVDRCLATLEALFGNEHIDIDRTMANPARICKLYGTVARKGDSTPERPHRRARILEAPATIEVVSRDALTRLVALVPEEERPQQTPRARPRGGDGIDLDGWLRQNGAALPAYQSRPRTGFRTFYVFDTCPWDPAHRDRSAFVGQITSGALVAGCHHNGCSGRTWRDLRSLVEPRGARAIVGRRDTRSDAPAPATTPAPEPEIDEHLTDAGNSDRLVRHFGCDIRYCTPLRQWFVWDGRRWEPDDTNRMLDLATRTAKLIFREAAEAADSESFARWALRSESLTARRAMIDGAVYMVPIRPDEMDAQPSAFNCLNGTLNLTTGEFREHRREDALTKIAGVRYDPGAECPLWLDHLRTVFASDEEVINAFQMVAGYSLLQYNPEQVAFILWGHGKNGKSETVKGISRVMGDYAVNIEAATLMESKHNDGGRARPDILRLRGARFVTCTEPGEGDELSEPLIKSVTGDHAVTARPLYGAPIEFKPGGKIFIGTNYKPKIRGRDEGIWRRIWLFPFTVTIPAEKRQRDYGDYLFEQEGSGILNWMVAGLRRYLDLGKLDQPAVVRKATEDYRIEMNPVGRYVTEWCVVDPRERVGKSDLFAGYLEWCDMSGWKRLTRTKFGSFMKTLFDEYSDGSNRYWIGIRRKNETERENEGSRGERRVCETDPPTSPTYTPDTISQTFQVLPHEGKLGKSCQACQDQLCPLDDIPRSVVATIGTYVQRGDLGKKAARCIVKGCNNPPEWTNAQGDWPLCAQHHADISLRAKREERP